MNAAVVSLALTLPQFEADLYETERAELAALVERFYAAEFPPSSGRYVLTTPGADAVIAWLHEHGHDRCAEALTATRPDVQRDRAEVA